MAEDLGDAELRLRINDRSFGRGLAAAGTKAKRFGRSMSRNVTAPVALLAALSIKSAMVVEDSMNTIRVGTGATGKTLEGLGRNFENVFKKVPNDAKDVSTAIADLNTRLGLSGKPLEAMATQMLNLARISEEEVGPLIATTTRLFGDWSVASEDQAATLDRLFVTSQTTGIGVGVLSTLMTDFGSPLRQLGLDFDFTAAMFARFEKEGVNTQTVLPGLKMALKNFAKAGKEPGPALMETFEAIKNAGSAAEANTMAFDIFGARAGPDMAAAIREGRFDLDELMKTIDASPDTINKAAKASMTFRERLKLIQHQVTLAAAPIGKMLIPVLEDAAAWFGRLVVRFRKLSPHTQQMIVKIALLAGVIGPLIVVGGVLAGAISAIAAAVAAVGLPVIAVIAVVVALGAAFVALYAKSKAFRTVVNKAFADVKTAVVGVLGEIKATLAQWGRWGIQFWNAYGAQIIDAVKQYFALILPIYQNALSGIMAVVGAFAAALRGDWGKMWSQLKKALTSALRQWKAIFRLAFTAIKLYFKTGVRVWAAILSGAGHLFVRAGKSIGNSMLNGLRSAWSGVTGWIGNQISGMASSISGFASNFLAAGRAIGEQLKNGIAEKINAALSKLRNWAVPDWVPKIGGKKPFGGIPKLAEGGIVTKPTLALIGEAGPEAVVPLGKRGGAGSYTITINEAKTPELTAKAVLRALNKGDSRQRAYSPRIAVGR